jgi:hypothetical protein
MTRKSTFDLMATAAGRLVPGEKLLPPKGLKSAERKRWASIVDPMPTGFFTREMTPQLRALVKAIGYAERLEAVVDRMGEGSESWAVGDERWPQLHAQMKVLQSWNSEILRWSRALRLTKQARYNAVKADAATKRTTTTAAKPWEGWRDGVTGDRGPSASDRSGDRALD